MTPSAIQLGSILAEPTEPHLPIPNCSSIERSQVRGEPAKSASTAVNPSTSDPSTIQTNNPSLHIDTEIHTTIKTNFTLTLSKSSNNKYGLFLQFIQLLGIGAEAGIELGSSGTDTFTFESETEEWFAPSMQFVRQSIEQPAIQMYLKGSPGRTPLYIVTGVRIAKGITAGTSVNKEKSISGQVSVDASSTGVPISVGPVVQHSRGSGEEVQWKCEGPLVFAYQLARIKPNKADWTAKSYRKGAFFGTERPQRDVEIGLDDDDFLDELEFVDIREGIEDADGTACVVVAPTED